MIPAGPDDLAARVDGVLIMSSASRPRIPTPPLETLRELSLGALAGTAYAQQLCWHGRQALRKGRAEWANHLERCPRCIVGARNFFLAQRAHAR